MIGAIADDVTGGTDVAVAFRRQGLRVGIHFGIQEPPLIDTGLDAAVVALKTRTAPAAEAVAQSRAAAVALMAAGATQLYFKYCSTFDSTAAGNIGPVFEALAELTGATRVVTTPSSPEHGRTAYQGQLFVFDQLLSESHMRDHPLTPMRDSSLRRLMDRQLPAPVSAVIGHSVVREGTAAVAHAIQSVGSSHRYVFPDAITDDDLLTTARAIVDAPLTGGAAGLAGAVARAHVERGSGSTSGGMQQAPVGTAIVLAGSCSRRTLEQLEQMNRAGRPSHRLDALRQQDPAALAAGALAWYDSLDAPDPAPLIYSSLPPGRLQDVQERLGVERSATILETAIAQVAQGLRHRGVTRFIAAGGETSGSVVAALGVHGGEIGIEAAQGVPWIHADSGLHVLLKSGNFGDPDLLVTASADGTGPMSDDVSAAATAIVHAARSLFGRGLTHGSTGNISIRTREGILVTPTGSSLGTVTAEELSLIDEHGAHLRGPQPSKEAFLHAAVLRARPHDRAVVHTHSTYAAAVSCMDGLDPRNALPNLTAYYAMRIGALPLLPYHAPGDTRLEGLAEETARSSHAMLLSNHGPVVAGGSLSAATDALEELEETAKLFLLLRGVPTRPLSQQQAAALRPRS